MPSALLPAHIAIVIRRIAAELRNVPRAAVTDRLELVHWLSRQARSLDIVADSRMLEPPPAPIPPAAAPQAARSCPACEARLPKKHRRSTQSVAQLILPFSEHCGGST